MQDLITPATLVPESERPGFLPVLFGRDFIWSEMSVYGYADKYIPGYSGGYWHFYQLYDGCGWLAPDCEKVTLFNQMNGYEGEISGEAAGLIITMLVLNHRAWAFDERGDDQMCAMFCHRYAVLREYADNHPEAAAIWRALD